MADAPDLGSGIRKDVWVQVPPLALFNRQRSAHRKKPIVSIDSIT